MLDKKYGHVKLVSYAPDYVHQILGLVGVHARRRLVEEQQARIGRESAGYLKLSLLAVRQVAGEVVSLVIEVEDAEYLLCLVAHRLLRLVVLREAEDAREDIAFELGLVVQTDKDVSYHAHVVEQADVLERSRDALVVYLLLALAAELFAV